MFTFELVPVSGILYPAVLFSGALLFLYNSNENIVSVVNF